MYLLIDLTFICPPLFTFVAPQEDEDQVVQDAAKVKRGGQINVESINRYINRYTKRQNNR